MPQLFSRSADTSFRTLLLTVIVLPVMVCASALVVVRSPAVTGQEITIGQPIPFSHQHHVSDAGIDCRYCHQTVESGAYAGVPTTQVCMNCHRELWKNADMLAPVHHSWDTGESLSWNRVHDLPDHVFFDHSIHVRKGIGCYECHGDVSEMPLTWQARPLTMQWCLDCHRDPQQFVRPRSLVFITEPLEELTDHPDFVAAVQEAGISDSGNDNRLIAQLRDHLAEDYHLHRRIDCYTCHR